MRLIFKASKLSWLPPILSVDISVLLWIKKVPVEEAIKSIAPRMILNGSSFIKRYEVSQRVLAHLANRLYDANAELSGRYGPKGDMDPLPADVMIDHMFFEGYLHRQEQHYWTNICISRKSLKEIIGKWEFEKKLKGESNEQR